MRLDGGQRLLRRRAVEIADLPIFDPVLPRRMQAGHPRPVFRALQGDDARRVPKIVLQLVLFVNFFVNLIIKYGQQVGRY